jgi:hypothetical protein
MRPLFKILVAVHRILLILDALLIHVLLWIIMEHLINHLNNHLICHTRALITIYLSIFCRFFFARLHFVLLVLTAPHLARCCFRQA